MTDDAAMWEQKRDRLPYALERGWEAAEDQRWPEAAKGYAEALGHPEFQWQKHTSERSPYRAGLNLQMGIAFVRAEDHASFEKLSRILLSVGQDRPGVALAKLCFLDEGRLPDELQQRALKLGRIAVSLRTGGPALWARQAVGIADYYTGNPEKAVELLEQDEEHTSIDCRGGSMVYRAMALKKLGHDAKAAELLERAEALLAAQFNDRPERSWWEWEICQLALEQAQREVGSSNEQ